MAEVHGKKQTEWRKQIWELLVAYVNTPDTDGELAFTRLVNVTMEWIGGEGLDSYGNLNDLENCRDVKVGESLGTLANRYKADVQGLLTWLARPGSDIALANRSCEFLMRHGNAIAMHWEAVTGDTDGMLISEWPEACGSVVSPLCRFIKDAIDAHDVQGEDLRTAIPIALCDRPGCGKFRIVKARRDAAHVFCSNLCKATFHQSAKGKGQKAEYMRDYRATLDRNSPKTGAPVKKAASGKTKGGK